ncbi:MAG TPA: hypothetical protein VFK54_07575 [Candidatus Limnocylindrales bacterium]|nr:hypothetical protein [Candidatus Limnocylindrales bacterium]
MQSTYPQQASSPFGGAISGLGTLVLGTLVLVSILAIISVARPGPVVTTTADGVSAPALVEFRAGERASAAAAATGDVSAPALVEHRAGERASAAAAAAGAADAELLRWETFAALNAARSGGEISTSPGDRRHR